LQLLDAGPQKDDSQAEHPNRSGVIAALPGKTIDGSLSEMEYALDALKMDGISTLIGEL
jgi:hypothetical protein